MSAIAVVLSVAAGMAGSVQVAVMSRFGDRVGVLEALAFAALGTAVITGVVLVVVRQSFDGYAAAARQPA